MAKVRRATLEEVKIVFEEYKKAVGATGMTSTSKYTYTLHVDHFIRWLDDDFEPGEESSAGCGEREAVG